ncbi:exosome complex protein Rrp4 [archaeon]|nr:exosome complex protein Rrp4 [archaeon]
MSKILMKEKSIVVPGEELAEGMDYLPGMGSFREGDKIFSSKLGLGLLDNKLIKVIPLTGTYMPRTDDQVIGRVSDISFGGWFVNLGGPYDANLSIREASEFIERGADLTTFYNFGDIIMAKVSKVIRNSIIDLSMKGPGLRKLKDGKIIEVTPSKVPRIIGKQGSMISLIKEKTNCKIFVGQNGLIWIKGEKVEDEVLATNAILKVDEESHNEGLTDRIKEFLKKGGKK